MGQQTAELDGFKTRKLYPDATVYRYYEVDWNDPVVLPIKSGKWFGNGLQMRGNGELTIRGGGIGELTGANPRLYFSTKLNS